MTSVFVPTELDIVHDDIFEDSDAEWNDYVTKSRFYLSEKLLEWAENLQQHQLFSKPSDYVWSTPLKRGEHISPEECKAALREWMDEEAGWNLEPLDHVYPCEVSRPVNRRVHWANSGLTHECETWSPDEYDRTIDKQTIAANITEEEYIYDSHTQTYMDPYAGVAVGPSNDVSLGATADAGVAIIQSLIGGQYGFFVETDNDESIPRKHVFPKYTGRRNTFIGVPI